MEQFKAISVNEAYAHCQNSSALMVDIRDAQSFAAGHVPGAFHLNHDSLPCLIQSTIFEKPIMVMCYHGHSSQGVAQYLLNQGFATVYSIDGGFEAWAKNWPEQVEMGLQHNG